MDERKNDLIENTLDFAILNALREELLDGIAIERRIQRARVILDFAAARKGMPTPAPTDAALQRLQKAGQVESVQPQSASSPERVYALTCEGRRQLDLERTRRESMLASFAESGALEGSFRRFVTGSNN